MGRVRLADVEASLVALHIDQGVERAVGEERAVLGAAMVIATDEIEAQRFVLHHTAVEMKCVAPGEIAIALRARAVVRGIRLNFENFGQTNPDAARRAFQSAVKRVASRKWHIQIYTRLAVIESLHKEILASPVPVVFDHFGGAQAPLGTAQAGFDTMLDLVRSGKAYVKISGSYRASAKPPDYPEAAPLAKALIAANAERIVWGSDWPHPTGGALPGHTASDVAPLLQIDDGRLLNQLAVWAPDPAVRKTILVDNPARLYGF